MFIQYGKVFSTRFLEELGFHFLISVNFVDLRLGLAFLSFVLLADPNPIGCLFRVNCGTKDALAALGYNTSFNTPAIFHSAFGHNVFPFHFRAMVWGVMFLNLIALILWENLIQYFTPRWNTEEDQS
jgi:cation-transporting ATPase 13A3/4/5